MFSWVPRTPRRDLASASQKWASTTSSSRACWTDHSRWETVPRYTWWRALLLGIRMSCKETVSVQGEERSEDCDATGLRAFDFGVAGGAEAEIGLSDRLALSVGASYNLGLLDVSDGESDEFLKNRTLTLRVGVVFPIG